MSHSTSSTATPTQWYARATLPTLAIFILLYHLAAIDRFAMGALINPIKAALDLTDEQVGRTAGLFTLTNIIAAPIFGFLGDRLPRKWFLLGGLVLWSAATVGSGLSTSFGVLLLWRALVGIGEAGFSSLAPGWLGDVFGPRHRSWIFSLSVGAGTAAFMVTYVAGGYIADHYGWSSAFFIAGAPGLALGLALLLLREPVRGQADGYAEPPKLPTWAETLRLLRSPNYLLIALGGTAYLFSLGGLSFWGSAYFHRDFGVANHEATTFFGIGYLLPGTPATLIGGVVGNWLQRRHRSGFAILMVVVSALAGLTILPALLTSDVHTAEKWILLEIVFATGGLGLANPLLFNAVPVALRNTAVAGIVTASGLGGVILQTQGIGWVSDQIGLHKALFLVPAGYLLSTALWAVLVLRQHWHLEEIHQPAESQTVVEQPAEAVVTG
jgi:MFS transporter, Spinster family, sphingosine-1-phosphate transporter